MVPVFKNVAKRSRAKNYCSVNLLYVVSEIFENIQMIGFFTILRNVVASFLISSIVSGLLDQLQIFWQ